MALRPPSAGGRLCSCLCGPLTIAAGLDRGVWAAAKVRVCLRSELQVAKSACRRTAEAAAAPRIVPEGHHEGPLRPRGDGRKRKRAHRPCSDAESAGRQAGADGRRHRPRGTAAASSLFHVLRPWLLRPKSPTNYSVAPESKVESELKRARQRLSPASSLVSVAELVFLQQKKSQEGVGFKPQSLRRRGFEPHRMHMNAVAATPDGLENLEATGSTPVSVYRGLDS